MVVQSYYACTTIFITCTIHFHNLLSITITHHINFTRLDRCRESHCRQHFIQPRSHR